MVFFSTQAYGHSWPPLKVPKLILPSTSADASADLSADMPEDRFIKLKILLKHSRMF